ncbi:MAG TPA: hypothetical protein PLA71_00220 [Saccharofermentans sp.]|nr:hypothetical protein [Saccharofermentans sp.]
MDKVDNMEDRLLIARIYDKHRWNMPVKLRKDMEFVDVERDEDTPAVAKNKILAKYPGYRHVCFIEEGLNISSNSQDITSLGEKYLNLLKKYELPIVFRGFSEDRNKVLDSICNHDLIVANYPNMNNKQYFSRHVHNYLLLIDRTKVTGLFDESYRFAENFALVVDLYLEGKLPLLGFFFEVEEPEKQSAKAYDNKFRSFVTPADPEIYKDEMQKIQRKYKEATGKDLFLEVDVSKLFKYLKDIKQRVMEHG